MPLQVPLSQEKQLEKKARPDKLALGGDGGFQLEEDKYEVEKTQALTVLPEGVEIPLPCPELPEIVLNAIKGVMVSSSPSRFEHCYHSQKHQSQTVSISSILHTAQR